MAIDHTETLIWLPLHYWRSTSQNGEDGILRHLFETIGVTNKVAVEFGVENGRECNTRYLKEKHGWHTVWWDSYYKNDRVHNEQVTAENITQLLVKYAVPHDFDLLSIDIDGMDYWIWQAIQQPWHPRVVIIEYNPYYPPYPALTAPYDPNFRWDQSTHFGASLGALADLGREKGYQLVCTVHGVNAVFVDKKYVPTWPYTVEQMWTFLPPVYDWLSRDPSRRSTKLMQELE